MGDSRLAIFSAARYQVYLRYRTVGTVGTVPTVGTVGTYGTSLYWYLRYRRYLPTVGRYLRYAALGTVGTEHVEHVSTIKKSHTDDWGRRGKGLHLAASTRRGGGIMIYVRVRREHRALFASGLRLESRPLDDLHKRRGAFLRQKLPVLLVVTVR